MQHLAFLASVASLISAGLFVGGTRSVALDANNNLPQSPRVVFIARTESDLHHSGSFVHRGISNAEALNASTMSCANVTGDFDVYIHVKFLCSHALEFSERRGHVLDVIDEPNDKHLNDARLQAVIFASDWDLRRRCSLPICVAIPHHYNLPCVPSTNKGTRVGVVGTVFFRENRLALEKELSLTNETLLGESNGKPCDFFGRLRIALAWHPTPEEADHSIGIRQKEKPAERFTNPIVLGIPTFGYRGYPSYAEYDPGGHFLCNNVECLREGIQKVDDGQLRSEFAALRARVMDDVSLQANVRRYRALIESVTTLVNGQARSNGTAPMRQWRVADPGL